VVYFSAPPPPQTPYQKVGRPLHGYKTVPDPGGNARKTKCCELPLRLRR
jgi:hypothetical protein